MYRGIARMLAVLAASACLGCPGGDGGEDYARRQAELADRDLLGKAMKVETALPSGVQLACDKLFDIDKLTEMLNEKVPIAIADHSAKSPDSTATCSIRRGGKPPDAKTQEKMVEETARLGVLGGDELCNVTLYCAVPADTEGFKNRCKSDGLLSNDTIGTFACVRVTPKGSDDAYTYRFIDPDSKCTIRVIGGPSVTDEDQVRTCARAAMQLIGPESLKQEPAAE